VILKVLAVRFISLHKKSPYFYKERDLVEGVI